MGDGYPFKVFLAMALFMLSGSLNAILGNVSGITTAVQARWTQTSTAASVPTQGGNITNVNISASVQLTNKWADFYGNVTGAAIQLRDAGGLVVYNWSYSAAAGKGEVCVSSGNVFPLGTPTAPANMGDVNTLWSLGNIDNASNTYNGTFSGLNLSGTVISPPGARLQGSSSFTDAAVYNGTTGAKANYAFCTNISSSGTNYANLNYNYELMVPTTPSAVETYYFYIELT